MKKLAPLGSLDSSPLGKIGVSEKQSLGSINKKPIGSLDKKPLSSLKSLEKSSFESMSIDNAKDKPTSELLKKQNSHEKIVDEVEEQSSSESNKDCFDRHSEDIERSLSIGDPESHDAVESNFKRNEPQKALRFGTNRSFLKSEAIVSSVDEDESEPSPHKGILSVKGILKSSPSKNKVDENFTEGQGKTLRQAMIQRDEKRIMFDLDANIEFTSEVNH